MDQTITVGDVLNVVGVLAGMAILGIGFLVSFAAGMASAPDEGAGRKGCIAMLVGALLLGWALWRLIG